METPVSEKTFSFPTALQKELMDSAYSVIYFTAAGLFFDILAENTFWETAEQGF